MTYGNKKTYGYLSSFLFVISTIASCSYFQQAKNPQSLLEIAKNKTLALMDMNSGILQAQIQGKKAITSFVVPICNQDGNFEATPFDVQINELYLASDGYLRKLKAINPNYIQFTSLTSDVNSPKGKIEGPLLFASANILCIGRSGIGEFLAPKESYPGLDNADFDNIQLPGLNPNPEIRAMYLGINSLKRLSLSNRPRTQHKNPMALEGKRQPGKNDAMYQQNLNNRIDQMSKDIAALPSYYPSNLDGSTLPKLNPTSVLKTFDTKASGLMMRQFVSIKDLTDLQALTEPEAKLMENYLVEVGKIFMNVKLIKTKAKLEKLGPVTPAGSSKGAGKKK